MNAKTRAIPADHVITDEMRAQPHQTCRYCGSRLFLIDNRWRDEATRNDGAVMLGAPFCMSPTAPRGGALHEPNA